MWRPQYSLEESYLECCHIDEGFTQGGGLATKLTIKARKEKLDVKGTQGSKSRKLMEIGEITMRKLVYKFLVCGVKSKKVGKNG